MPIENSSLMTNLENNGNKDNGRYQEIMDLNNPHENLNLSYVIRNEKKE